MSEDTGPNGAYADLADLTGRRDALRQAAGLPDADPRAHLRDDMTILVARVCPESGGS